LGADYLFGGEPNAIKGFYIFALLATIVAITLYYKVKIPSIKFESMKSRYEWVKKTASKTGESNTKTTAKARLLDSSPQNIIEDIASSDAYDKQTLKSMIKEKLSKSVKEKESAEYMRQTHINFPKDKPTFPIELLEKEPSMDMTVDEDRLLQKAQWIKNKLAEFGIDVDIEGFNIGPTVMQIKIKPQAWVKVSKIENLKKDLALWLRTKSLRVLAPIPGTDSVGIEIPNPKPQVVRLGDTLSSLEFSQSMKDNRTGMAIGKWIDGQQVIKALEKMPHLLVAGATGSGKSVWVNWFITSLIYQNTPSELKFIMVDPKQVELGMYEWIPYLLAPIITQPDKAVKVLKWAVQHMNERYKKLKDNKVKHIWEYNAKMTDEKDKMFRLVIIIDELADLMMSGNKKDTEQYIARIAQMARAVGMHLILATQRPSVNVITGLIKANIPTRISFGVVSQIDSRTILDSKWAEDLVGKWDLLYMDPKSKFPIRIQGPFIDTPEIENVVNAIKEKYMSNLSEEDIYHPEIMNILSGNAASWSSEWADVNDGDEELIEQAIEIIAQTRKASATMLQRKLGVWFPRAARLIDILEERGVVGPQEWAKASEILI
jgi:DNA segregation ATPase FtsK/SpoIIIE, S-DNA-T family